VEEDASERRIQCSSIIPSLGARRRSLRRIRR
jgi:hypothetical protein